MNVKVSSFILFLLALIVGSIALMQLTAQETPIAQGFVLDTQEHPITGAVVRVRGTDRYVLTDADGAFRIPLEETDLQLTAWMPGYFIGGDEVTAFLDGDGGIIHLHPHPTEDNADYAFISPVQDMTNETACAHCHADRTGEGALPVDEWLLDAHSGAATNPRFLSLYNGTTLDGESGALTAYRYDETLGFDVPVAPSLGQADVGAGFRLDYPDEAGSCAACHAPILALDDPFHADPNTAQGVAAEGVTCDFCHKLADVTLQPDGLPDPGLPGVLSMTFLRPHEGEQVFIGPYDDTAGEDIYSALQNESQLCATCHTGQFWDVPIYNSFGEWLDSPYSDPTTGQTCQDCHMPHTGATTFVQLPPNSDEVIPPRDPQTIFSHRMPGATDATLLQNTASVEVETHRAADVLNVTVRVTNTGAGHHIPTDNPLRNMILLVTATDADGDPLSLIDGAVIPEWGGVGDPEDGYYAGLPGVLYAKVLADRYTGEMPTAAYWRPTILVSDNRLPALETDESAYTFALPVDAGEVTVTARLLLRRAFIDVMAVKAWDTPDQLMAEVRVEVAP